MNDKKPDFPCELFLKTILDNSDDTIYFKDLDSKFILNSRKHLRDFGVDSQEEVTGKSDYDFFGEDFAKKAYEVEQRIIKTKKPIINNIEKSINPDGSITWYSASKFPFFDDDGNVIGTWGMSKDITDLKEYEENLRNANKKLVLLNKELEEISSKDELSSLYNRRFFYNILYKLLDSKHSNINHLDQLSVILIDIDKFKSINDTFGHIIGDKTIRHSSKILKNVVGDKGLCFRYGGDELSVICLDIKIDEAVELANEIRKTAEETPFVEGDYEVHFTFSIGVSNYTELDENNKTPDNLVEIADKKLYKSKLDGRNKVTS